MVIEQALDKWNFLVENVPNVLIQINEDEMAKKVAFNKWSKKEILGHLIDSATNNHQRFVRGQFETVPEISYDQNNWNTFSYYQQIDSQQIITFWTIYNRQLIEIIKRIPSDNLKKMIRVGAKTVTIENLVIEYIEHLEHHLNQLVNS
ncbi:MAG: DinB family protein [Bacteroidetes bacterium]|nr:DinB family protein [Bacteroidota bacterium]MBK9047870.1 DinB family protein [Bacteroidota bacterium]MBL0072337.1 DinB family protein [Bacteroidota bacterium]